MDLSVLLAHMDKFGILTVIVVHVLKELAGMAIVASHVQQVRCGTINTEDVNVLKDRIGMVNLA